MRGTDHGYYPASHGRVDHAPEAESSVLRPGGGDGGAAMKATAILKDFNESFFSGIIRLSSGEVSSLRGTGFDLLDARGQWNACLEQSYGSKPRIPVKIGDGSFRARMELHDLMQRPHEINASRSPRVGYTLVTFIFQATP